MLVGENTYFWFSIYIRPVALVLDIGAVNITFGYVQRLCNTCINVELSYTFI